jgi:hypothetical protein
MTAQDKFWRCFGEHEEALFNFDPTDESERERLFDELAIQLQKVYPKLTFEFGPKGAQREFVISADGIKDVFPAVVSLTNAAPPLHRWKITAFRPRRDSGYAVEIEGKSVDPAQVQFTLLDNGKTAGIYLFIPGFREDDFALQQIAYLMLDALLGEYDVETRLGLIKMLPPEANTIGKRHPLAELPHLFDRLTSILEGRTQEPS